MSAEPEPQTEAIDPVGHIVRTPGVMGGRPRIAGTRMRVVDVVDWHSSGTSIDEIIDEFELSAGDVYAALTYYYDHREEIEGHRRDDEAYAQRLLDENPEQIRKFGG